MPSHRPVPGQAPPLAPVIDQEADAPPDGGAGAAAAAGDAPSRCDDAPVHLSDVCRRLATEARGLLLSPDGEGVAARFLRLEAALADPDQHYRADPHYGPYLHGDGARLLSRLATALKRSRLTAEVRGMVLLEVALALGVCLAGFEKTLRDAVHRLECASGGVTGAVWRAREELQQEILDSFVRRTVGRDPSQPHSLASHHVHFVGALEAKLKLPRGERRPIDIHLDPHLWSEPLLKAVKKRLETGVSFPEIALRMTENAMTELRFVLGERGVDAQCIRFDDPWQEAVTDEAIQRLELTMIGPVPHTVLLEEVEAGTTDDAMGDAPPGALWRLTPDAGWVATQVLRHLNELGLVEPRLGPEVLLTRRVLGDGQHVEILCLGEVFCWARMNRDSRQDRRLTMEDLRALDRAQTVASADRQLTVRQREAIALAVLPDASDDDFTRLHPRWLVSDELARRWQRRLSPEAAAFWWMSNSAASLPPETVGPIAVALDEAGDWERLAKLAPTQARAAIDLWHHADGIAAVAGALRTGDAERVRVWLSVLRNAVEVLKKASETASERCFVALTGKDERGVPALTRAMHDGSADALAVWLDAVGQLHAAGRLDGQHLFQLLAGGTPYGSFSPLTHALQWGRADLLEGLLHWLRKAVDKAWLKAEDVAQLMLQANRRRATNGQQRGELILAVERGHVQAIRVWMEALLGALREGVLSPREWIELMRGSPDGDAAYVCAMERGKVDVQELMIEACRAALAKGLVRRGDVAQLLLPRCGSHGPSLAAKHGQKQALEIHLRAEAEFMSPRARTFNRALRLHWLQRGAHTAVAGAMANGDQEAVRMLLDAIVRSTDRPSSELVERTFSGPPEEDPCLLVAVGKGYIQAISAWVEAASQACSQGWMTPAQLRRLLRAEGRGAASALHVAVSRSPEVTRKLAKAIVDVAATNHLGSRRLMSLLGCRKNGIRPSPLALAIAWPSPETVRRLLPVIRDACERGLLKPAQVRALLSLKLRDGRRGLALPASNWKPEDALPTCERTARLYADAVIEAVKRGEVSPQEAGDWLFAGLADVHHGDAIVKVVENAIDVAEGAGLLKTHDAIQMRGRRTAAAPVGARATSAP